MKEVYLFVLTTILLPGLIGARQGKYNRRNTLGCCPSLAFVTPTTNTRMSCRDLLKKRQSMTTLQFSSSEEDETQPPKKEEWKIQGEEMIRTAAIESGADPTKLDISWGLGTLKVTVGGSVMIGDNEDDDLDDSILSEDDEEEGELLLDDDDELVESLIHNNVEMASDQIDIVTITRAINVALSMDEDIGMKIAETHEIEVTTPGASDILQGDKMFEAYRGFDVIVETSQLKKNGKPKILEGKLVEKDENELKVNVNGRISKVKNEFIVCVRLPKPKKEKKNRKK